MAVKPELAAGGGAVFQAYDLIDQSRLVSDGWPQSIQVSEVLAYIKIAGIEAVEDRLQFLNIIKTLDVIYLNHYAECHKNE